jgi:hypothetical protein
MNSQKSLSIAIPEFKEDSDEDSDEGSEENESDDVNTSMESRLVPHGVSPMTPGNIEAVLILCNSKGKP